MEKGQSSGAKEDEDIWAKLVPTDPSYPEVEIRSGDAVICSQITESSSEKREWCEIARNPDHDSATIRNISSQAIIVDGTVYGEEAVDIKSGIEIISGPDRKGCSAPLLVPTSVLWLENRVSGHGGTSPRVNRYLGYTFELIPIQEPDHKNIKISLDVEHAKCSICLNVWHDVVTIAPCLHNFCNGCFSEWLRRSSTQSQDKHQVVCPQCRATVNSVGRNHFLHNIEEAILQAFSSLKRSDDEIALSDTYASIKTNLVLPMQKNKSRKRPLSTSSDGSNDMELPCPQCGTELGGFRCSRTTPHLRCQGCGGMMPSRPNIGVPQHCLGCDRAFCGAYWLAQGLGAGEFNIICSPETFKPILERSVSRIPDSAHDNNIHERVVTDKCIQQTGKTLQAVISEWIIKFNNREIDRTRLQINHADTITARTHLCNDCFSKLVDFLLYWFRVTLPRSVTPREHGKLEMLYSEMKNQKCQPPDASQREDCWYGYLCRTQHHSADHAQKRNHVCRPTRGLIHML